MKKFIVRIIVFFVAIALIDIIFGRCCDYMYEHSKSGDSRKINYAIRECNADILIMGSSRANHHYDPQIMTDSLGLSCYNLGVDGSGAILMNGFYRLISQRYIPKLIIYELTPSFDFYQNSADANNTRYLAKLKPYYREKCLKQLYDDVDGHELLKLFSGLYRYNTSCMNLLRSFYGGVVSGRNGYEPLNGAMTAVKPFEIKTYQRDSLKIKYLKEFIHDCKKAGTEVVFVVSPRYGATTSVEYFPVFDMCRQENCKVLDHFCDSVFIYNKEYFKDPHHLNAVGADNYSNTIIKELKEICMKK